MEYWVYGDLSIVYPEPYSIDLRGTVGFTSLTACSPRFYSQYEFCGPWCLWRVVGGIRAFQRLCIDPENNSYSSWKDDLYTVSGCTWRGSGVTDGLASLHLNGLQQWYNGLARGL